MGTVLGGLLLPDIRPFDLPRTTNQAINAAGGMLQNQTALLALEDARRQQEAQAIARQYYQANPQALLGGAGGGPTLASPDLTMGGGGALTQTTTRPADAVMGTPATQETQTALAPMDLSRFATGTPGGPQPTLATLAPQARQDPLEAIIRQNPDAGMAILNQRFKLQEMQLGMRSKVAGAVGQLFQGVTDQASWEQARSDLATFAPQIAARLPQGYNKEVRDRLVAQSQTAQQNAETLLAEAQATLSGQKAQTEQWKREVFWPQVMEERPTPSGAAPTPTVSTSTARPTGARGPGTLAAAPPEIETYIAEAHRLYPQVRPELIRATMLQESYYNPNARGSAGEIGLMQLKPGTAKDMGVDPTNPRDNTRGGTRYLAQLLQRYGGDERRALAAYNQGMGRVPLTGEIPEAGQRYADQVLGRLGGTRAGTPAAGAAPAAGTTTPEVARLNQRIDELTQRRDRYAAGSAIDPGLNTYADNLTKQIDELRQERNRLEEIPRAVEKQTAEARARHEQERERQAQPMLPEDRRKLLTGLRTDIRQEPTFKLYQEVRNGYQNVKVGARSNSAQGDLAIINGMAKILDPGGVVMTGEARNVEEAQGQLQRWFNSVQKFFAGDRLTPENRQRFLTLSQELAQEKLTTAQQELRTVYEPLAKEGNIQFGQLLPLEEFKPLTTTAAAAPSQPGAKTSQAGPPAKVLSEADISATMKASGKTRQEVIDAALAKGYTVR